MGQLVTLSKFNSLRFATTTATIRFLARSQRVRLFRKYVAPFGRQPNGRLPRGPTSGFRGCARRPFPTTSMCLVKSRSANVLATQGLHQRPTREGCTATSPSMLPRRSGPQAEATNHPTCLPHAVIPRVIATEWAAWPSFRTACPRRQEHHRRRALAQDAIRHESENQVPGEF